MSWRKLFFKIPLFGKSLWFAYGPKFICWAQWHQDNGEWCFGFSWITVGFQKLHKDTK